MESNNYSATCNFGQKTFAKGATDLVIGQYEFMVYNSRILVTKKGKKTQ